MFLLSVKLSMPDLLNILILSIHCTHTTCMLELISLTFSNICFRSRKIECYSILQLTNPWFLGILTVANHSARNK